MNVVRTRTLHRGMSLVELAMALAVAAIILTGIMVGAAITFRTFSNNDELAEVRAVEAAAHSLFSGATNYNLISSTFIASSGVLSSHYVTTAGGTQVVWTPNKQAVTITSGGTLFRVSVPVVGISECSALATGSQDISFTSVNVNGTTMNGRPMTPAEAVAACAPATAGAPIPVTFTFF